MTPDEQHQLMVSVGRFQTPPYDKEPLFACVDSLLAAERAAAVEECAKVCDDAVCTYNSNEQDMLAKQLAFLIRARKDA